VQLQLQLQYRTSNIVNGNNISSAGHFCQSGAPFSIVAIVCLPDCVFRGFTTLISLFFATCDAACGILFVVFVLAFVSVSLALAVHLQPYLYLNLYPYLHRPFLELFASLLSLLSSAVSWLKLCYSLIGFFCLPFYFLLGFRRHPLKGDDRVADDDAVSSSLRVGS